MKRTLIALFLIVPLSFIHAQSKSDTIVTKSGWGFGGLPAIAYNSDLGLLYGAVANFYDYGDGSIYPSYRHRFYLEWTRSTKGSGTNDIRYDSEYLIPGYRLSAQVVYYTEQALDFYGFNGAEAKYNPLFEEDLSRMYYRYDRKMFRVRSTIQKPLGNENFRWLAGFAFFNFKQDTVDITTLNKGNKDDLLPPINGGLFGYYQQNDFLPASELKGGQTTLLKAGLVYDTRDNEANPNKGVFVDGQLHYSPGWLGSSNDYLRLILTHRQYITVVPGRLTFAYRMSYQSKIAGEMPYYMLPFLYNPPPANTHDGLGGEENMRGVLRNRLVGEGYFFSNTEFRWKFYKGIIAKQNIYLALSPFLDIGRVTKRYEFTDNTTKPTTFTGMDKESFHFSAGAGFFIAVNENFVIAIQYGKPFDKQDGESGFYIGLDFAF